MKRSAFRIATALVALASLVFSQLALSAFACAGPETVRPVQAMDMPGCDMAPAERNVDPLCQAHCLQGDASVQQLAAAAMPALCAELALAPVHFLQTVLPPPPGRQGSLLERRTGPPLAVLHCRFLI